MRDNTLFYSDEQAVTATAASTNVLDLGAGDIVHGLYFVLQVGTAFAGVTKVSASLETSDDADFTASETVMTLPDYPLASLTDGAVLCKVCLPVGMKKYSRVKYTVTGTGQGGTGTGTAGTISAFLMDNPGIGED